MVVFREITEYMVHCQSGLATNNAYRRSYNAKQGGLIRTGSQYDKNV